VSLAHLTQEVRELEPLAAYRVIEAIEDVARVMMLGDREVSAGQLATRLGFTGGRQQTRVGDLSGGERRRLQILRLLMAEPNVLLLDEPTNDLDIDTLTSLEDVLDGWAGTLVVVSHDRYLLERVCDRQVALLGDGRVRDLPGGVDEYLRLRRAVAGRHPWVGMPRRHPRRRAGPPGVTVARVPGATQREARKELARVERALVPVGRAGGAGCTQQMAEQASDHQAVLALDALRALVAERAELEDGLVGRGRVCRVMSAMAGSPVPRVGA
jgi:ATP-binding cassette subfamily F protein uup